MKISLKFLSLSLLALPFLGGCGKQGALDRADLSRLEQGFESRQTIDDVTVSVKQLTPKDREYVFGSKNLAFSPVLLTIDNKGKEDLFFDTRKQSFNLVKAKVNGAKILGSVVLGQVFMPLAGFGLGAITFMGALVMGIAAFYPDGILPVMIGSPILGLGCCAAGVLGGKKIERSIKDREAKRIQRINFLSKTSYVIEKNNKESILLFFEKNKVPGLLPLSFEVQIEPAQTLNFELSTNRESQSNKFVYKTV